MKKNAVPIVWVERIELNRLKFSFADGEEFFISLKPDGESPHLEKLNEVSSPEFSSKFCRAAMLEFLEQRGFHFFSNVN